ncbi:chromosome partitioning protein ParA [Stutzerimonas tarimensis]|uniref:Chromosome partitioning protein ParA n=1 Tax=Stutzerimonas tarimensis TaxID=1507735 RepID=A0ABV7T3N7_9GAMM
MRKKAQMAEAVLFFRDGGVCKEMLYPEFEAVLDGVVNLPEFAEQQIGAAFVVIDPRLAIRAAVFFYLDFHEDGAADSGWNIPLRMLAERGGRGPDLGSGPIRMVCRSQCPVSWHQMHLWDPLMKGERNHLALMRDRVKRNGLGLIIEEEATPSLPAERLQIAAEDRWYTRGPFAEPREAAPAMAGVPQYVEGQLKKDLQDSEQARARLSDEIARLHQLLKDERGRAEALIAQQAAQTECFRRIREELSEQLRRNERKGQAGIDAMRDRFELEAQARITAVAEDFQKRIVALQDELLRRDERQLTAETEIARLEAVCADLREQIGRKTLERLADQGMVFVVYHPGAGQLTVPVDDIEPYQQNPQAYAAAKCSVSLEHYRQWLDHYMRPACQASMLNGSRCGIPVDRIDLPMQFVPGVSDCCSRHRGAARRTGS